MNINLENIKSYLSDRPELVIEIFYQLLLFTLLFAGVLATSAFLKLGKSGGENLLFAFYLFVIMNFYNFIRNYKNEFQNFSKNPERYTAAAVPLFKIIPIRNEQGKIKWTRINLIDRKDGESKS